MFAEQLRCRGSRLFFDSTLKPVGMGSSDLVHRILGGYAPHMGYASVPILLILVLGEF